MKKIQIAAALAVAALTFTGCENSSEPKASMNNAVDSLSYMYGLAQGDGMKTYYLQRSGIDSTNVDQFIKGILDGAKSADDKGKNAYYMGLQMGQNIANNAVKGINYNVFGEDSTKTISVENLFAGLVKGLKEKNIGFTQDEIRTIIEEKDSVIKEQVYGDVKKAGMDFLAENAKKEGVKVTESGLQYKIITEGKGAVPTESAKVDLKYVGKFIDGTEFDSSRGEAVEMIVNRNIDGFKEALMMMPVGSTWEIYIPYNLGYGSSMRGSIKPFSTLIFNVELVSIKNDKK